MASPRNRRTAPYVIMNNHAQPPSVAYSARSPTSLEPSDGAIRALAETPLQPPNSEERSTSFYRLVRRAQVSPPLIFCVSIDRSALSEHLKLSRCKLFVCLDVHCEIE